MEEANPTKWTIPSSIRLVTPFQIPSFDCFWDISDKIARISMPALRVNSPAGWIFIWFGGKAEIEELAKN